MVKASLARRLGNGGGGGIKGDARLVTVLLHNGVKTGFKYSFDGRCGGAFIFVSWFTTDMV